MKSPAAHLPTAYDWISAEDVIRHALAAFYCICRESDAYRAENYEDPHQVETNDRRGLATYLAELFEARLLEQGFT